MAENYFQIKLHIVTDILHLLLLVGSCIMLHLLSRRQNVVFFFSFLFFLFIKMDYNLFNKRLFVKRLLQIQTNYI